MRRVIGQRLEGAPHETLLVVDATTGQNGLQQARLFGQAVDVTGVVLTKLDGSAKGGIAIAIAARARPAREADRDRREPGRPAAVRSGRLRPRARRQLKTTGRPATLTTRSPQPKEAP